MKRSIVLAAVVWLWAGQAQAQTAGDVSLLPLDPPRWEISGDIGWLSSNKSEIGQSWQDWYDAVTGGAILGRYWTTHLKTELRIATSGDMHLYEELPVSGSPPVFRLREHDFRKTTLASGAHYQFLENQWFHPQLGAGLEVEREADRQVTPRWPQYSAGAPLVLPEVPASTSIAWAVRPFVAAGFKWYVSERAFVRSDVRVSIGTKGISYTAWTAGIGVDL